MKKISTEELLTPALVNYLDGVLGCCGFGDDNLKQYVTGRALELLEKLPETVRGFAIGEALAAPDYDCINGFPCNRGEDEFFLPPTELEIDVTNLKLESPDDFYIKTGGCKLAYYAMDYGALIGLDLEKLADYVSDFPADQENK